MCCSRSYIVAGSAQSTSDRSGSVGHSHPLLWICRISQLAAVSGKGAPGKKLLKQLMDTDFDPDAWDQHMASAFGDDYYAEAEPEMDIVADADNAMREAQQWKGDEGPAGDGEAEDSDEEGVAVKESTKTFDALHRKLTGKEAELLPETDYAENQGDGDGDASSGDSGSEDDGEGDKVEKLADTRDKVGCGRFLNPYHVWWFIVQTAVVKKLHLLLCIAALPWRCSVAMTIPILKLLTALVSFHSGP